MFFLNVGYRRNLTAAEEGYDGVLYVAFGHDRERLSRAPRADTGAVLFDPQLYLAGLDAEKCSKFCARLASYPWFGVEGLPQFDSGTSTRQEWMKQVQQAVAERWPGKVPTGVDEIAEASRSAISFQLELGCSQIILPSPLLIEPEQEAEAQGEWLDAALIVADSEFDVEEPVLATVALHDSVLSDDAFSVGGLLDTIADQVTARSGLDGVYIAIEQAASAHPFETPDRVLRAYLRLCQTFAKHGYDTVLPNFVDVFGLSCMAAGATGFANGPSHPLRRLSPSSFQDESFGIALPHFYSHRLIAELLPEQDLDRLAARGLIARVRDVTPHSQALMETLVAKGSAAALPQWAESRNNQTTASKHFIRRLANEEGKLSELGVPERIERVRDWLIGADATSRYLDDRLRPEELAGKVAPARRWLACLDSIVGV
jgi:hypothetical protein